MSLISSLSIAPMIDWTNSHFRVLMRLLAPRALVYTEMQTPGLILNRTERALAYEPIEHPIALQLGGARPDALARCAQLAQSHGFDEINLNLGCPSDRVQSGQFGACMMADPDTVMRCIDAMKQAVSLPVTAKIRIGIDEHDSYAFFSTFAHRLVEAGCDKLIVHARKAWLSGLSPKQNRTIPPLHYDYVYRLKKALPTIPIVINGHIQTIEDVQTHLTLVDGVMIGRLACQNPYAMAEIHHELYPADPMPTREAVLAEYSVHAQRVYASGVPLSILLKPLFNLYHGRPGARAWKARLMQIQQARSPSLLNFIDTIDVVD